MRQFSGSGVRIWNLSREAKAVYTGFLFASVLAFVSSFALAQDMMSHGTASYYGVADSSTRTKSDGPALALPDEVIPAVVEVKMPYRKLLEVAHFHLFTIPVFLLIVTHLFMLTGLMPNVKLGWIVAAWTTSLGHIFAPFVVRYGGAQLAWVFGVSGAAMALPLLFVTVYPAWVMWALPPDRAKT